MPKIPVTEESVRMQAPQAPTVRAREYQIPGAVPGAFGENVSKATENFGKTMGNSSESLFKILEKKREDQETVKAAEIENKFMLGLQDIEYGPGTVSKKDANGNDITVPRGTKLRLGYSAEDSVVDMHTNSLKLREDLLQNMPDGLEKQKLDQRMQAHFLTKRESQIVHATTQIRAADKDTFVSRNKTMIDSVVADPATLGEATTKIQEYHRDEQKRFGDSLAETAIKTDKDLSDAVFKAADSLYRRTMSEDATVALAESAKDKFSNPGVFQETMDRIEKNLPVIKKTADYNVKLSQVNYETDLVLGLADGSIVPQSIDIGKEVVSGRITQEFAKSLKTYRDNPIAIDMLSDPDNDAFVSNLQEIFDSKDKAGVRKAIVNVLKGGADGKLSQDQFSLAIKTAAMRNKGLGALENAKETIYANNKQLDVDAGFRTINDWADTQKIDDKKQVLQDYVSNLTKNMAPNVAVAVAQRSYAVKKYPPAATMENPPNMIVGPDSNIKLIFPTKTKVAANRLYNPKTRKFDLNPEIHTKSEKK
jgi:hypothetical protein